MNERKSLHREKRERIETKAKELSQNVEQQIETYTVYACADILNEQYKWNFSFQNDAVIKKIYNQHRVDIA